MFDEEEYHKRDPHIPNMNINKDDDGNYQPYEPLGHSLMPYSFFVLARIVLGGALLICLPLLIFSFSESVKGYFILLGLYLIITVISKVFKFTYLE